MQMLLFAVGEGVCGRILASDSISLNANLAKYREGIKAERMRKKRKKPEPELGTERKKPITEALKSRVAGRHFAIDKVKQSENVSPSE